MGVIFSWLRRCSWLLRRCSQLLRRCSWLLRPRIPGRYSLRMQSTRFWLGRNTSCVNVTRCFWVFGVSTMGTLPRFGSRSRLHLHRLTPLRIAIFSASVCFTATMTLSAIRVLARHFYHLQLFPLRFLGKQRRLVGGLVPREMVLHRLHPFR